MPELAIHFHLAPDDVWAMTGRELDEFLDALDEIRREIKRANRKKGR